MIYVEGEALRSRYGHLMVMTNIHISGCQAAEYGGGLYREGQIAIHMDRAVIRDNRAQWGGGMAVVSRVDARQRSFLSGSSAVDCRIYQGLEGRVTDSVIADNYAEEDGGGVMMAGWFRDDLDPDGFAFVRTNITNNFADRNGGGFHWFNLLVNGPRCCDRSISLLDSRVDANQAGNDGGGIFVDLLLRTLVINRTVIADNVAARNGGGYFYTLGSRALMDNSLIVDNIAMQQGGGAYLMPGTVEFATDSSFLGNYALHGGGIFSYGFDPEIEAVILLIAYASGSVGSSSLCTTPAGFIAGEQRYSLLDFQGNLVANNEAVFVGGGVATSLLTDASSYYESDFVNNTAGMFGGGVALYLGGFRGHSLNFANNSAGGVGGSYFSSQDSTTNVTGMTISGSSASARGGGLAFFFNATATIDDLSVVSSTSPVGGALFVYRGATVNISNAVMSGNDALVGGGVASDGVLTISDSRIENNEAITYGGGVLARGPEVRLQTVQVSANEAPYGGGVAVEAGAGLDLDDVDLTANVAEDGGGAWVAPDGNLTVAASRLTSNVGVRGGAVFASVGSRVSLGASSLTSNAAEDGGAAYLAAQPGNPTDFSARDCAFDSNVAVRGGALFGMQPVIDVDDCSFDTNAAVAAGGAAYWCFFACDQDPWTFLPSLSGLGNTFGAANTALYGPNLASEAVQLSWRVAPGDLVIGDLLDEAPIAAPGSPEATFSEVGSTNATWPVVLIEDAFGTRVVSEGGLGDILALTIGTEATADALFFSTVRAYAVRAPDSDKIVLSDLAVRGFYDRSNDTLGRRYNVTLTHTIHGYSINQEILVAPCPGGFRLRVDAAGLMTCAQCAPGTYSPNSTVAMSQACMICPPGRFANAAGMTACTDCAVGTYAPVAESSSCRACEPGRFADRAGLDNCLDCPPGSFQKLPGNGSCSVCPAGTIASGSGLSECTACELGRYALESNETECATCNLDVAICYGAFLNAKEGFYRFRNESSGEFFVRQPLCV